MQDERSRIRKMAPTLLVALVITLLIGSRIYYRLSGEHWENSAQLPPDLVGSLMPAPKRLTDFQLTDHLGQVFTLSRLRGLWTVLFFGYTHCPDVCPTSMGFLHQVFTHLGESPFGQTRLQGVFVSVDPKRDSLGLLKDYVTFFNPGFFGVTGKESVLKDLAHQVGAYYAINPGGSDDAYEITHSSAFFLISPDGRLVGIISQSNNPPDMAADKIRRIVNFTGGKS
ncbi:MAG: SCO family protein [Magnetococcales bacterium]|nr:SCO family protein [Magnetococcales bacterium]MBF0321769.1 SCO family protein [Magnetococcales bacterium]